jgi:aryl-alcohol dehydrogenase-like predicted oxidoreductase
MSQVLLGRTNRYVFPIWARGRLTGDGTVEERAERLTRALLQSPIETLDISPAPAVWGRFLREQAIQLQIAVAAPTNLLLQAPDARIAANLVQSHIIETLCAVGRTHIDYYFLSLHEIPNETQLSGALEALELARQEGQIGAIGLAAYGKPLAILALWRTRDAFEVALLPDEAERLQTLLPEAHARRAGVVVLSEANRLPDKGQVVLSPIEQAIALASALHK